MRWLQSIRAQLLDPGKVVRWIVFLFVLPGVTYLILDTASHRWGAVAWLLPGSVVWLITRNVPGFSGVQLIEDLKRVWKWLLALAAWNVVVVAIIALAGPQYVRGAHVSIGFMAVNVLEELVFRSALIPLFGLVGSKLFGVDAENEAVVASSLAWSLMHVGQFTAAPPDWFAKTVAVENMAIAVAIGVLLGKIYWRSRNFPSVLVVHWWLNFQNRALTYLASLLLG